MSHIQSPYIFTKSTLCRMFAFGNPELSLMALQYAIDESGTHKTSPNLCVGGYVGNVEQWDKFDKAWRNVLQEFGIPFFHARQDTNRDIRNALVRTIHDAGIHGIVTTINKSAFHKSVAKPVISSMGGLYGTCVLSCGYRVHKWIIENDLGPCNFIFEQGVKGLDLAVRQFKSLINHEDKRFRVKGVSITSRDEFIGLQAADFLVNSRLSMANGWFSKLNEVGDVHDIELTIDELAEYSTLMEESIRGDRRRVRQQRRRGGVSHE